MTTAILYTCIILGAGRLVSLLFRVLDRIERPRHAITKSETLYLTTGRW